MARSASHRRSHNASHRRRFGSITTPATGGFTTPATCGFATPATDGFTTPTAGGTSAQLQRQPQAASKRQPQADSQRQPQAARLMRLASLMLDGGDIDYDALPAPALRASPPTRLQGPRPAPLQELARAKPIASAATPTAMKSVPPLPPATIRPDPSIDQPGSPRPSTINTLTRTVGPPSNSPYVAPRKYQIHTIVDLSITRNVRAGVMLRHVCHRVDSILKYHAPYSTFKFGLTSDETIRWDFYLRLDSFSNKLSRVLPCSKPP